MVIIVLDISYPEMDEEGNEEEDGSSVHSVPSSVNNFPRGTMTRADSKESLHSITRQSKSRTPKPAPYYEDS